MIIKRFYANKAQAMLEHASVQASLNFFWLSFPNCITHVFNCDLLFTYLKRMPFNS